MVGKDTVGHPAQVISKTFTVLRQSCPKRLEKLPSHTPWKEGNFPWTTNTQATEFWVGFINESVSTKWNKKLLPKFRPETSAKIQTSRSSNPTQPQSRVKTAFQMRLLKTSSCMAGKAAWWVYSDGWVYMRSLQAFLCQIQSPNPGQQLKTGQENFVKCAYLTDTPQACFYTQEEQEPFSRNRAGKLSWGKKKDPLHHSNN